MNITLIKQWKIRKYYLERLVDYREAKKLKLEICDYAYKTILDSLTEEELWLINLPIDNDFIFNKTEKIQMDCNTDTDSLLGIENPLFKTNSYRYQYNNKYNPFKDVYYPIIGYFSLIKKESPILPRMGTNNTWEVFSEKYPEQFKIISKKLKQLIEITKTIDYKMRYLDKLLNSSSISLKDVNKYFPELYNLIKNE